MPPAVRMGNVALCCASHIQHPETSTRCVQAGDRVKAMKALMLTHDAEKVTLFASVSRDPAVYLLAAQFLQTAGTWRHDEAAFSKLAQFYAKAKSPLHAAAFYETCAQAEMDEASDFVRAASALQVPFPN